MSSRFNLINDIFSNCLSQMREKCFHPRSSYKSQNCSLLPNLELTNLEGVPHKL
nr:hypothetical protein Iba_scaffold92840CG0010 [Ipomoea batatas]